MFFVTFNLTLTSWAELSIMTNLEIKKLPRKGFESYLGVYIYVVDLGLEYRAIRFQGLCPPTTIFCLLNGEKSTGWLLARRQGTLRSRDLLPLVYFSFSWSDLSRSQYPSLYPLTGNSSFLLSSLFLFT